MRSRGMKNLIGLQRQIILTMTSKLLCYFIDSISTILFLLAHILLTDMQSSEKGFFLSAVPSVHAEFQI